MIMLTKRKFTLGIGLLALVPSVCMLVKFCKLFINILDEMNGMYVEHGDSRLSKSYLDIFYTPFALSFLLLIISLMIYEITMIVFAAFNIKSNELRLRIPLMILCIFLLALSAFSLLIFIAEKIMPVSVVLMLLIVLFRLALLIMIIMYKSRFINRSRTDDKKE